MKTLSEPHDESLGRYESVGRSSPIRAFNDRRRHRFDTRDNSVQTALRAAEEK